MMLKKDTPSEYCEHGGQHSGNRPCLHYNMRFHFVVNTDPLSTLRQMSPVQRNCGGSDDPEKKKVSAFYGVFFSEFLASEKNRIRFIPLIKIDVSV